GEVDVLLVPAAPGRGVGGEQADDLVAGAQRQGERVAVDDGGLRDAGGGGPRGVALLYLEAALRHLAEGGHRAQASGGLDLDDLAGDGGAGLDEAVEDGLELRRQVVGDRDRVRELEERA